MPNRLTRLLPYRLRARGGFVNTTLVVPFRRLWLQRALMRRIAGRPDSITVVIGIRNRSDYRLRNALWSIRHQSHPPELVKIVVVDYGSSPEHTQEAQRLCENFGAAFWRVSNAKIWSKPKCLNLAIKQVETKFLLSSDVDVIFPDNYIAAAIAALKSRPLAVIYSRMLDLAPDSVELMQRLASDDLPIPFPELIAATNPRGPGCENAGINASYTFFYQLIRGYDEFFEGWGSEDNDLQTRFHQLGLDILSIYPDAVYLHQWHPKGEGVGDFHGSARRNKEYLEKQRSIFRNRTGWGEGP